MKKIIAATLLLLGTIPANPALANNARGVNTHLCGLSERFDWSFDKRDQGNFLGVWDGYWGANNELSHTLIVHVAKNGKAKAYYPNATYEPWGVSAGCHLVEGEFSATRLSGASSPKLIVHVTSNSEPIPPSLLSGSLSMFEIVTAKQRQPIFRSTS